MNDRLPVSSRPFLDPILLSDYTYVYRGLTSYRTQVSTILNAILKQNILPSVANLLLGSLSRPWQEVVAKSFTLSNGVTITSSGDAPITNPSNGSIHLQGDIVWVRSAGTWAIFPDRPIFNANKIRSVPIGDLSFIINGQVLRFNGTELVPSTDITTSAITVVANNAARDAIVSPFNGQGVLTADTNNLYVRNGSTWELLIAGYLGGAIGDLSALVASLSDDVDALSVDVTENTNDISAIKDKTDLLQALLAGSIASDGNLYWFLIDDTGGQIAFGVDEEGKVYIHTVKLPDGTLIHSSQNDDIVASIQDTLGQVMTTIRSNALVEHNGVVLDTQETNFEFYVSDVIGQCIMCKVRDGRFFIEGVSASGSGGGEVDTTPAYVTMLPNAYVETDINSVPNYGQSLSLGYESIPAISTVANGVVNYNNKMLVGGVRTQNAGTRQASFIPLVEQTNVDRGETPSSGTCNYLTQLLGGVSYPNSFVAYASGQGGQSIFNLSKENLGSFWYTRLTTDLQFAHNAALALNDTHSVPFWTLTQHEGDYNANTPQRVYMSRLINLQNDFANLANSITGQKFIPSLIQYQGAAHRRLDKEIPILSLAQLEATKVNNTIHIATPAYPFTYAEDGLHLDANDSKALGYYYALAAFRVVWLKNFNTCLHPKQVIKQDATTYDLVYDLVHSDLRINTSWVREVRNYGYDIRGINNAVKDIVDEVTIPDLPIKNIVRITTTEPLVAGDQIVYGYGRNGDELTAGRGAGPAGNICDSQGDDYNFVRSDAGTFRLDNYALISRNFV